MDKSATPGFAPRSAFGKLGWLIVAMLLVLLGGCASFAVVDRAAIASTAIGLSKDTELGRIASSYDPGELKSGFRLMPLGPFSLDTRIELARRAQVSLDVQYYHIENDETGRWLMRALRDAAERGVRVRLLVDDFYLGGQDELFLALAAHKNVEVRIFNPFCCLREHGKAVRYIASVGDWKRVNHRMHNKLFVADGAMAVIGGRNVANEYYLRSKVDNFIDIDAFAVGFIVAPAQALFDRYWNALAVYPIHAVTRSALSDQALRRKFELVTGPQNTPPPEPLPATDILGYGPISEDLRRGRLSLIWAYAYIFADHPDKPFEGAAGGNLMETSVTYNVFEALRKAKTEVVVSSPYLVPGKEGMALIHELRTRNVNVVMMTNSLGATDEPVVHLGYYDYRDPMLDAGVELYEISSSRIKRNMRKNLFSSSLGRLHAKLAVVDQKTIFVGSMNLDPRSATINTELGAVIASPELAGELLQVIDIDRLQSAYRVRRTADGQGIEWVILDDGQEMVLTEEPDSTFWLRLKLRVLSPLIPEDLL